MQSLFKLKVIGDLKYFLGLEIAKSTRGICLSQHKYTLSLLEDTGFINSKPTALLMDPHLKLSATDDKLLDDASLYQRMIRRLMYFTISGLDIAYPVHKLSQLMSQPRVPHLHALHQSLHYLKSFPRQFLLFTADCPFHLTAYADAN